MEQNTMILVLSGAVVAVAVLVWAFRVRRKRSGAGRNVRGRLDGPELLLEFRYGHPGFGSILDAYLKQHSLDDLHRDREVGNALEELADAIRSRQRDSRKNTSRLGLVPVVSLPVHCYPAMLTLIRAMYADPAFASTLPEDVLREMDRLVDSLTR